MAGRFSVSSARGILSICRFLMITLKASCSEVLDALASTKFFWRPSYLLDISLSLAFRGVLLLPALASSSSSSLLSDMESSDWSAPAVSFLCSLSSASMASSMSCKVSLVCTEMSTIDFMALGISSVSRERLTLSEAQHSSSCFGSFK